MRASLKALSFLAALLACASPVLAQQLPPDFEERFALAADREAALEQLVPGSRDWLQYRCLLLQQQGRLDESQQVLDDWAELMRATGESQGFDAMQARQELLDFSRDPEGTWAWLRQRFDLRFDQRRDADAAAADVPSRLDPARIAYAALLKRAMDLHPDSLDGLTDAGLERLEADSLSPKLRTSLLKRLTRPDRAGLARLVVADLRERNGARFGDTPIHRKLLEEQLAECARLEPSLLESPEFTGAWARRLRPGSDVDLDRDDAARLAWLERLEAFVKPLAPVHNSLKAHVLRARLQFEHEHGRHDADRLLDYLKLPREGSLRNPLWVKQWPRGDLVDPGASFSLSLPDVGDDEELVRACLLELFRDAPTWKPFATVLREDEITRLFAESKLLFGVGSPESWYPLLGGAAEAEALRSRVELKVAPSQPRAFAPQDAVFVDVDTKNVQRLLVRVFALDAFNVYTSGRDIDPNLDLDGLLPNEEQSLDFSEGPLRRVRRHIELPALAGPGAWVVELVAGGLSSRAFLEKGALHAVSRTGAAGHVFHVLDDDGRRLDDASIWLDGRLFRADEHGEIAIPWSAATGDRRLVLVHGQRASLGRFEQQSESWSLSLGGYVDREALLARGLARLVLRPALEVNGRPAAFSLLRDPVLRIVSRDVDGVESTQERRDLALSLDAELVHELQVPERLVELNVFLSGRVVDPEGQDVPLSTSPVSFALSRMLDSYDIAAAFLGRDGADYVLDVLGRSGEPLAGRALDLRLLARDFTEALAVSLRTDAQGRVVLGPLSRIESVKLANFDQDFDTWSLTDGQRSWPALLCGTVGQTLRLPAPAGLERIDRTRVSLLEHSGSGGSPARATDRFDALALVGRTLELRGLPAGSFDLLLKDEGVRVSVEITQGAAVGDWLVGKSRLLPATSAMPLQITSAATQADALEIRLQGATEATRVHVFASRWLPPFDAFTAFAPPSADERRVQDWSGPESFYEATRYLSDEQRYVLERRQAHKFPGNMLQRPTLLLDPWTLEETDTGASYGGGAAGGGGKRGRAGGASDSVAPGGRYVGFTRDPGRLADFAFLAESSRTLANLRPDADGLLRIPLAELGSGSLLTIVAVDDESTELLRLGRAQPPLKTREQTLSSAFASDRHLTETRRIDFLPAGASAAIADVTTAQAETLDSLDDALRLLSALSGNAELSSFSFLTRWPKLTREEKLAQLSERGCHELRLFVREHDPELFEEVVRPYLRNKLEKTFLDHWLLDEDLSSYLEPWRFGRLNVMERILLAQRLPETQGAVRRALSETLALRPRDPAAERRRFDAALRGTAMDTDAGLADALEALGYTGGAAAPAPAAMSQNRLASESEEWSKLAERGDSANSVLTGKQRAARDAELRESARPLYRGPGATRRQVEHNYWHVRAAVTDERLLPVNGFWLDFANATPGAPFVSTHLAEAAGSINEMLLALALTDLPFEAKPAGQDVSGTGLSLRAASPLLLVSRQLADAQPAEGEPAVFLGQELFRADERFEFVAGEQRERFVRGELQAGVAYGSLVVITNPVATPQRLEVLVQVPQGAVPLEGAPATRGVDVHLGAYATTTVESHFYFPRAGDFPHWPAHVSRDGRLLVAAAPAVRHVVDTPEAADTGSWEWISQNGTSAELWDFLDTANLQSLPLARMAWRLQDAPFFRAAVEWFGRRRLWDPTLWSFGLRHQDADATREWLRHQTGFAELLGPVFSSTLLDVEPVERKLYEHVEFTPLVNARAHPLRGRHEILNPTLAAQCAELMHVLAWKPALDDEDWLVVSYYLLLQDRVEDALAAFAKVAPERLPGRLQHDLMAAYLAFFGPDPQRARPLAEAWKDHPIPRWRDRFREVLAQLDEAEGRSPSGTGAATLAQTEPVLELELERDEFVIRFARLDACELRWFPMDAEQLFSRDPFGEQSAEAFALVRPLRTDTPALRDDGLLNVPVPPEFRDRDVLLEARGGGLVRRQARYASALAVELIENRGQLRVAATDGGHPLPAVYVKVFARSGGQVRFHKDGYTDLRGRFDYASVSGEPLANGTRFSILVLGEGLGTVIRQVDAPAR